MIVVVEVVAVEVDSVVVEDSFAVVAVVVETEVDTVDVVAVVETEVDTVEAVMAEDEAVTTKTENIKNVNTIYTLTHLYIHTKQLSTNTNKPLLKRYLSEFKRDDETKFF